MSVIPVDFGQVTHVFSGDALVNPANVTYGVSDTQSFAASLLAQQFHNLWVTDILPMQGYKVSIVKTIYKKGPNSTGASAEYNSVTAGGVVSEAESSQVAIIAKKNTAAGGKWNRGRMYIPGAVSAFVNLGGQLDSSYLSDWQDAVDQFMTDFASTGEDLVILHNEFSTSNGVKVPNPHADDDPAVVTSLSVESLVATQRRRLRR